jgi:hypothetical protein
VGTATRTEAITALGKARIEDRHEDLHNGLGNQPVKDSWNPEPAGSTPRFRQRIVF